jgi:TolA-binding protein
MFRTERYAEAEEALKRVVVDSLHSAEDRAEAYFNLGNAQFAQQKLQEA